MQRAIRRPLARSAKANAHPCLSVSTRWATTRPREGARTFAKAQSLAQTWNTVPCRTMVVQ
eukprot:898666-Prymnesium_polylepis.1